MGRRVLLCLAVLVWLVFPGFALADVGPKPTAGFQVTYEGVEVGDDGFSAAMMYCDSPRGYGSDYAPVKDPHLNVSVIDAEGNCTWIPSSVAWGGDCRGGSCSFSYSPPEHFRLLVYLPSRDKVFISKPERRVNFHSTYSADLLADGSIHLAESTPAFLTNSVFWFIKALTLTLGIELVTAWTFFKSPSRAGVLQGGKFFTSVILANLISLPVVWFVFPRAVRLLFAVPLAEAFAVVFEACFIYLANRRELTPRRSLMLSAIMNLVSFFVGGFILFALPI